MSNSNERSSEKPEPEDAKKPEPEDVKKPEPEDVKKPEREDVKKPEPEVPSRSWLRRSLRIARRSSVWTVTTLFAALIGAAGVSYYDRSQPRVAIADIGISDTFHARFRQSEIVSPPLDDPTFEGLIKSDWVTPIRRKSIELNELIKRLQVQKDRVITHLESVARLKAAMSNLMVALERTPSKAAAEYFFDLWEENDALIHGSLRGQYQRGVFEISTSAAQDIQLDEPAPQYLFQDFILIEINREYRKVFRVAKYGSKFASYLHPSRARDLPLNEYVATALSNFDRDALKGMLMAVKKEFDAIELHKALLVGLDKFLKAYSRWSIAVLLSNRGKAPVSFSPTATLYIDTKGTKYGVRYANIPLEHRGESGELEPISLQGGDTRLVRFVSPKLVIDTDNWEILLSLFENSSRRSFVEAFPSESTWFTGERVQSPPKPFSPTTQPQVLSPDRLTEIFRND